MLFGIYLRRRMTVHTKCTDSFTLTGHPLNPSHRTPSKRPFASESLCGRCHPTYNPRNPRLLHSSFNITRLTSLSFERGRLLSTYRDLSTSPILRSIMLTRIPSEVLESGLAVQRLNYFRSGHGSSHERCERSTSIDDEESWCKSIVHLHKMGAGSSAEFMSLRSHRKRILVRSLRAELSIYTVNIMNILGITHRES
jgi:hypothetical protein